MNRYWKSVGTVFSGAVVAQLIPIIGSLFIVRLYTTSAFGLYSAWLAIVYIFGVIFSLRFDHALAIESDGEKRNVAVVAVVTNIIITAVIVSVILTMLTNLNLKLFDEYDPLLVVMLGPASALLALNVLWQGWAAADGEYRNLNYFRIAFSSLSIVFQIGVGLFFSSELILAASHIFGLFISFLFALYFKPVCFKFSVTEIRRVISFWVRRRNFLIYSLPADLINVSSAQLPVLIVTSRFGPEVGGVLALTMRVLGAPIGILGKAVLDVFKRYAAQEHKNTGQCRFIYIKTFKILAVGSLFFCVCVWLVGEHFFRYSFGHDWADAGIYAIWLLPMFALRFIASPLSYTIYIVEKQDLDLMWQFGLLIMTIVSLFTFGEFESAILSYSAGYSIMYFIYLRMTFLLSKKNES